MSIEKQVDDVEKISFEEAKEKELASIQKLHPNKTAENLVGPAFSGGGIRSATFGLGVLETLKKLGLLEKIDYLSTVSDGGYIGAWLMENVYLDMNLEDTWEHEDNKGWMELFKQWANSPKLRDTWNLTKSTYGVRFQSFWARNLYKQHDCSGDQ